MKISIIYYSKSGNTETVAKIIAKGIREVPNSEVSLFNIVNQDNWDTEFIAESRAVIFGTPTYFGNMCW